MSKANAVGDLLAENVLRWEALVVSGDEFETISPALDWIDNVAFQLITEDRPARSITHNAADSVVAGTGTWHFVNGAFTAGDVGGTVTVANAANGGNNGAKTILTVVDATHITTATTGLVDETFGSSVTASVVDLSLDATWGVETSLNYVDSQFPNLNQIPNALGPYEAKWSPIGNDEFSPPIEDVTASAESSQYVQLAPFAGRRLKFTLTATGGAALVTILYGGKGTR